MAPNCLFFAPVTLPPKIAVICALLSHYISEYKARLHVESTEKPVYITVENAYSLFKPWNITVTTLDVTDTS